MREEKRNKIIAAIVVNAVLAVFIIVGVLIAQIVEISVLTRRKNTLMDKHAKLSATLVEMQETMENLEDHENDPGYILMFYELTDSYQDVRLQLQQLGVELPPSVLDNVE